MIFRGRYFFLSNFYPAVVTYEYFNYPTVEHAYQAAKTVSRKERMMILSVQGPGHAKRLAKRLTLREDWEAIKILTMADLIRQKFSPYSPLANRLIRTGEIEIVEDNYWGDTFWGVCNGAGENHLGKLLMQRRSKLTGGLL